VVRSGFRGLAHWITDPYAGHPGRPAIFPHGPSAGIDGHAGDSGEDDDGLNGLLAGIADEVHRHAAAARGGVMADFAAQVAHARKHYSPHLLAAVLAAIKQQRDGMLALINRNAADELAARRKAVIMAFRPRRRNPASHSNTDRPSTNPGL
jgi:hypothetical protein